MKFINHLPIKIKLILIVLAVSLPVLILFAVFNVLVNVQISKDSLKAEIENVAKMTTDYTRPLLLMQDQSATEQMIQYNQLESIDYACIYDAEGEIVSEYSRVPDGVNVLYKQGNTSEYKGRYLHTFSNSTYEDEVIGTLFILSNTDKLNVIIRRSIQNTLAAILVAIVIALLLVLVLQSYISRPILALANFASDMTDSPDYGRRIDNQYQDEIGTLYTSFNKMLDAIDSTTVSRGYLNDILSSMAEMLIVLDNDFKIQKVNDAVTEQTGYLPHELIGKKIDVLLKRMTNSDFYQSEQIETSIYTKQNQRKIVSISLSGLNTASLKHSTIICTARDITEKELAKEQLRKNIDELKVIQEQLKVAKELAEASSQAKSEFLSKMSHEIRTPMNAIMGMAHILLQNNPEPEQQKDLKNLLLSTESLLTLINDILDFSQIETGQVIFQKREFNLQKTVQDIVRVHDNDKVDMELVWDDKIPSYVKSDEKRFSQILNNLVHNAVKFTQDGKVTVRAKVNRFDKSGVFVAFEVEDTGVGIPADKIDLIFESFSQVDNSLSRQYQGKGLGLSIVKHLLQLQNSEIKVESTFGAGSIFSFVLRFETVPKRVMPRVAQDGTNGAANVRKASLEGLNVLLVEDNQMNIIVTKKLLKNWKVNVDVALNGKIGAAKADQKDYDIILMDLQMPVMDGFSSTRLIRQMDHHQYTPIIALTAEVLEESQDKAKEVGMNDFVTKPFKPNVLFQAMAQFASRSEIA